MNQSSDMPKERWEALMDDDKLPLTPKELKDGWHFCGEWDGLLIGPGMMEMDCCTCERPDGTRYKP